jgi:hypothetical protein
MIISKDTKIKEIVEYEVNSVTLTEAMGIVATFFENVLQDMEEDEIDEMYMSMGAGRNGLH